MLSKLFFRINNQVQRRLNPEPGADVKYHSTKHNNETESRIYNSLNTINNINNTCIKVGIVSPVSVIYTTALLDTGNLLGTAISLEFFKKLCKEKIINNDIKKSEVIGKTANNIKVKVIGTIKDPLQVTLADAKNTKLQLKKSLLFIILIQI